MSLKSNYTYIRDWINEKFLKKSDVDLTQYPTHEEVSDTFATKTELDSYLSIDDYRNEEEIIAASLTDLDNRIEELPNSGIVLGENEERVIAIVLSYLNSRLDNTEDVNNKVTSISSSSTDIEYPSAKCIYDRIAAIETRLSQLEQNQGS